MELKELMENSVFPVGGENINYAQYFDEMSYLNMLSLKQVIVGNVTFEPGCRNHWHIHHVKHSTLKQRQGWLEYLHQEAKVL